MPDWAIPISFNVSPRVAFEEGDYWCFAWKPRRSPGPWRVLLRFERRPRA